MLMRLFVCLLVSLNQVGILMLFCCKLSAVSSSLAVKEFCKAQCYGQFGELKDWWPKLLSSVRRTELKESEFTKSSLAIWRAANCATKISLATLLLISHRHQSCIRDGG